MAGLPVAVHLLTRPRPVRMPLSTVRLLREAVRQRRAAHRLRDLVVLSLRTLAILLIALAIARPQFGRQPLVSQGQAGSGVRVVILDTSQSMAAVHQGVGAIERGRTIAAEHLRYRPGLHANLVIAGARPRAVFGQPSQNFEALRDELSRSPVLPQRLDINRALALAGEMLAPESETDDRRRELVIVSDFQRSNWAGADFSQIPEQTQVQLESVAPQETPANMAVLAAYVRGRASEGSDAQLAVEVGNYSPALRQAVVEVQLGEAAYRLAGPCPAGRRTTLTQEIPLRQPGWQWGQARLIDIDDALPEDNSRPLAVYVRSRPLYALLTRQPAQLRPSSSHYLECALVPDVHLHERASAELVRFDPANLSADALSRADLIVLDHPGTLSEDAVRLLSGLMRRGRPLLYVASELSDAANLRQLAEAAGRALQIPVEFLPPPRGQVRRDLFLASLQRDAAPFNAFGDEAATLVKRLRFAGGLSSRRVESALQDHVLATYNDGTACLVFASSDAGSLAVINADLNQSNLPATEAFVPIVEELVERLLEPTQARQRALPGEPLLVRLPAEARSAVELQTIVPEGAPAGDLLDEGIGVTWRWAAAGEPGIYRVVQDDAIVFSLAVAPPEEESQLESLAADVLENRLAAGRSVYFRSAFNQSQQEDHWWTWLLAGCVTCLLGELTALAAFRS